MTQADEDAHDQEIYDQALEDVALWLETKVRVGTLSERIDLADAIRDGSWHQMPVRATASRDVAERRAEMKQWRRDLLGEEDIAALAAVRVQHLHASLTRSASRRSAGNDRCAV